MTFDNCSFFTEKYPGEVTPFFSVPFSLSGSKRIDSLILMYVDVLRFFEHERAVFANATLRFICFTVREKTPCTDD